MEKEDFRLKNKICPGSKNNLDKYYQKSKVNNNIKALQG